MSTGLKQAAANRTGMSSLVAAVVAMTGLLLSYCVTMPSSGDRCCKPSLHALSKRTVCRGLSCRGLAVEEFPLLLLSVGEYIAVRRGLVSKADALAGKRSEVSSYAEVISLDWRIIYCNTLAAVCTVYIGGITCAIVINTCTAFIMLFFHLLLPAGCGCRQVG